MTKVVLKDGQVLRLRPAAEEDAVALLRAMDSVAREMLYLLRSSSDITLEEEQAFIAWAAEQGLEKENLGVRAENERARALYQKFGFVAEGCKRREIKDRRGHCHNSAEMACFLSQDSDPWAHGRKEQGSA
jgi:hypothetical protein